MININNKSNINTDKIIQVISLLPEEYTDLDVEVRIYGTRWSLLKTILNKKESSIGIIDFFALLKIGTLGGYSGEETNKIELYPFSLPKSEKDNVIQNLVFTIFHEIRHKYQSHYMREFYKKEEMRYKELRAMKKTKDEINNYLNLSLEKDADEFAFKFYIDNQDKIDKIFEINYEYSIDPIRKI